MFKRMKGNAGMLLFCLMVYIEYSDAKRCLKNAEIGWRNENIYSCDDVRYPECCEKNREFTCCEPRTSTLIREQLQLWGIIILFVMSFVLVYLYKTRSPITCCSGCSACSTIRNAFESAIDWNTGSKKNPSSKYNAALNHHLTSTSVYSNGSVTGPLDRQEMTRSGLPSNGGHSNIVINC